MIAVLTNGDTSLEYDVSMYFYDEAQGRITLQLKQPKVYDKPARTIYSLKLYNDTKELVILEVQVLYLNYHVTIDDTNPSGQAATFVNNSFGFEVL